MPAMMRPRVDFPQPDLPRGRRLRPPDARLTSVNRAHDLGLGSCTEKTRQRARREMGCFTKRFDTWSMSRRAAGMKQARLGRWQRAVRPSSNCWTGGVSRAGGSGLEASRCKRAARGRLASERGRTGTCGSGSRRVLGRHGHEEPACRDGAVMRSPPLPAALDRGPHT